MAVGALAIFGTSAPTDQKSRTGSHLIRQPLVTNGLKEGAAGGKTP
jgi:hypothetical protein